MQNMSSTLNLRDQFAVLLQHWQAYGSNTGVDAIHQAKGAVKRPERRRFSAPSNSEPVESCKIHLAPLSLH